MDKEIYEDNTASKQGSYSQQLNNSNDGTETSEMYSTCGILDRSSVNTAALVKSSR